MMPNTQLLIEHQIQLIAMQNDAIKERDQIIKNQHRKILDLEQQVSRMESVMDAEAFRKEGSI